MKFKNYRLCCQNLLNPSKRKAKSIFITHYWIISSFNISLFTALKVELSLHLKLLSSKLKFGLSSLTLIPAPIFFSPDLTSKKLFPATPIE